MLMLHPVKENKLQLAWTGPMKIIFKMNDINYIVQKEYNDRSTKVVHTNMIKLHYSQENVFICCKRTWVGRPVFSISISGGKNVETGIVFNNPDQHLKTKACCSFRAGVPKPFE